jgi:uncharacterized protein YndB with AHSA1/START domain
MALTIKTQIQIQKPVAEVFEAIVDPAQMSHYFISSSTGRMDEGKSLKWRFPEFDDDYPVRIGKISKPGYISFYWEMEGIELLIEINLTSMPDHSTHVIITEKEMPNDEKGINWLKGNTEGWANFLACLKAWLEYGINLRKGAYEFYRK